MILFLTSSPCGTPGPEGASLPFVLDARNALVENLRSCYVKGLRGLMISAYPDGHAWNDRDARNFAACFAHHGMQLVSMTAVDDRHMDTLPALIRDAGLVILGGGHVPTQNAFFQRIGLKAALKDFDGVVLGISAGTMNCAEVVYAQPEEDGEATNPGYQRFLPGLGLTRLNVLPHAQQVRDRRIDGLRLYEDVTFPDSFGRVFYALPDGSYIMQNHAGARVFGEAYAVQDGRMTRICTAGESCLLKDGKGCADAAL